MHVDSSMMEESIENLLINGLFYQNMFYKKMKLNAFQSKKWKFGFLVISLAWLCLFVFSYCLHVELNPDIGYVMFCLLSP